jgi:hypothetical protein
MKEITNICAVHQRLPADGATYTAVTVSNCHKARDTARYRPWPKLWQNGASFMAKTHLCHVLSDSVRAYQIMSGALTIRYYNAVFVVVFASMFLFFKTGSIFAVVSHNDRAITSMTNHTRPQDRKDKPGYNCQSTISHAEMTPFTVGAMWTTLFQARK